MSTQWHGRVVPVRGCGSSSVLWRSHSRDYDIQSHLFTTSRNQKTLFNGDYISSQIMCLGNWGWGIHEVFLWEHPTTFILQGHPIQHPKTALEQPPTVSLFLKELILKGPIQVLSCALKLRGNEQLHDHDWRKVHKAPVTDNEKMQLIRLNILWNFSQGYSCRFMSQMFFF